MDDADAYEGGAKGFQDVRPGIGSSAGGCGHGTVEAVRRMAVLWTPVFCRMAMGATSRETGRSGVISMMTPRLGWVRRESVRRVSRLIAGISAPFQRMESDGSKERVMVSLGVGAGAALLAGVEVSNESV